MPGEAPTVGDVVNALRAGRIDEGRRAARAVLAADPGSWPAWHLTSLITATGASSPPLAAFQRAALIAPDRGELWASLAAALERHGLLAPALGAARRAIALLPAATEALINLGAASKELGRPAAAALWLDRAKALAPANPAILNNIGLVHLDKGELPQAATALHQAIVLAPLYVDARLNLAIVERRLERPSTALAAIVPALMLSPSDSAFLGELGTILVTIGEAEAGLGWLGRALAADPASATAMTSFLGAMSYAPNVTEARRRAAYDAATSQARRGRPALPRPPAAGRADGRITIGYVSASWYQHPMAQQLASLLAKHRHDRVRTIAYADLKRRDAMTDRLRGSVEAWREVTAMTDRALTEVIRADAVDALVFLALHEDGSRRFLPALRAAPVQVSLHDISTSGFEEMDAWITDDGLHPAGNGEWFSERLIRLPSLFLFPLLEDRPSPPPPMGGGVRLASFNNPAKLSTPTLEAWAAILRAVPSASLLLKYRRLYDDPGVSMRIRRAMAGHGVDVGRVQFATGALPLAEHLDAIAAADIVLDPFPYNGNTATMEALWMGVPVVSLAGSRFVGRMGTDLLDKIGRRDLVARDEAGYVAMAIALANDPSRRDLLRQTLRSDVNRSVLVDAGRFARSFEDAVIGIVDRHRRGDG
jgi:predicted O-linked N-acetylglucosamine transferase (SPINDLY family)